MTAHAKLNGAATLVITAMLTGSDTACAESITVTGASPVLALCRRLVDAGRDQNRPLHAYRGDVPALRVRSIGEGARLEIRGDGVGFRRLPKMGAGPPMRRPGRAAVRHRAGAES
jgi:hypothetical protein